MAGKQAETEKRSGDKALTDKDYILSFIRSLSLCDHMGDVADNMQALCRKLGIELPNEWSNFDELSELLEEKGVPYWHELPKD